MIIIQMTGMSGAGKTTISHGVQKILQRKGYKVEVLDGDEYRLNLCSDLGFSKEDRNTNIRRLGFVAKVLARNGVIAIISAINPYKKIRKELTLLSDNVKTVYVECPLETLKNRDTKNLYYRSSLPEHHPEKINNLTGVSDPFEEPLNPDLVINTAEQTIDKSVKILEQFILRKIS